jgi:hypothetical protein
MEFKYINCLPEDVIINHIIPYTYNIQPKLLLYDIKNYTEDLNLIKNAYTYDYNFDVLLHDLIQFCNNGKIPLYIVSEKYCNIVNRHIKYKDYNKDQINNLLFLNLHKKSGNIFKKIRFIWGLLLPIQRTRFINDYVLGDF